MMEITHDLVLLCEGEADRQFFRKLIEKRAGLPSFDMPFPTPKLYGNAAFSGMLNAIAGAGHSFERVRGVLLVADSGSDPDEMFKNVRDQVAAIAGYPVPSEPDKIANGSKDFPATAITFLPDSKTPGALETLLIREISARRAAAYACAQEFLKCGDIDAHSWPPEARDKATFGCLIAATNKSDPNRAASWVFKGPSPPRANMK